MALGHLQWRWKETMKEPDTHTHTHTHNPYSKGLRALVSSALHCALQVFQSKHTRTTCVREKGPHYSHLLTFSANKMAWLCTLLGFAWCSTMVWVGSSREAWGQGNDDIMQGVGGVLGSLTSSSSLMIILLTMLCTDFSGSSNMSDRLHRLQ